MNFEPKKRFYSIPVLGQKLENTHTEFSNICAEYRNNYVRSKDIERIKDGILGEKERERELFKTHITIGETKPLNVDTEQITNNIST